MLSGIKAKKINSEEGDGHKDGEACIVIGETVSIPDSELKMYVVIWEDLPAPVLISTSRLIKSKEETNINPLPEFMHSINEMVKQGYFILYEKSLQKG